MELVLTRYSYGERHTSGILKAGPHCFQSLELAWRGNRRNVSCIPEGVYPIVPNTHSSTPKFNVEGVPGRLAIQIHSGNSIYDIEGCILLGMNLDTTSHRTPRVTRSRDALHALATYLHGMTQGALIIRNIYGGKGHGTW